ncbi:sodium-independent sulfate anion transporter-like isoform X2 [Amphiura filiformis]|uniref:sodium-independent sulfate anion transporter-like isoform X2 n=1 Tax=Amphiura filiformis TaxID=82378 RepID=UPI003B21C2B4
MDDVRVALRDGAANYCSLSAWKRRFPLSIWLPKYKASYLLSDIIAGFTVGLTVIPQALAYASIAKLHIQYGLYSAFMGCFVYFFLGTSKDVSVGPTAIMSLLVSMYGEKDPNDKELHLPEYAVLMAFICGCIQFALGFFHLGALTGFISSAVIAGFTSASAITIAMGQVKHILGQSFHGDTFLDDIILTFKHIKEVNGWDVLLGVSSMVILYLLQKVKNDAVKWEKDEDYTPTTSKLLAWKFLWFVGTSKNAVIVIMTAIIAWTLEYTHKSGKIALTGNVTEGIPMFEPPEFGIPDVFQVLNVGIVIIPLIGYLEAISIGKSFGRQNNYKVEPNQELIALGICNVAGSFVSSYPVTGSFSRTAINSQCGVKTPAGGLITGGLVLLSLQFLTPAFYYIPKASLAAVIIMAVIKMVNYRIFIALWKVRKLDLLVLIITFIMCLCIGVAYGTLIGIGVDIMILLYPIARPRIRHVDPSARQHYDITPKAQIYRDSVLVFEVDRSMRFPASEYIVESLYQLSLGVPHPKPVILDFTHVTGVDYTMIESLHDALEDFGKAGIKLVFCSVKDEIKDQFLAYDLKSLVVYSSYESAIQGLAEENAIDEAAAHLNT